MTNTSDIQTILLCSREYLE